MNPFESPKASELGAQTVSARSLVVLALVSLHISAILYLLVGCIAFIVFDNGDAGDNEVGAGDPLFGTICASFCVVLAAGVEVVAYGIHKRRFWGWIAGLVVCGIYTPSLFFPLGILGLWGLLAPGSRTEFGVVRSNSDPTPPSQ